MSVRSVKIDEKARTLTIEMDLDSPRPSASGKTLVVASSRGNQSTDAQVDGKTVTVGVNAYIRP